MAPVLTRLSSGGGFGFSKITVASAAAATAATVSRSLRFNSADSAYLSRTPASAGNRKTWTWSGWVKKTEIISSGDRDVFGSDSSAGNEYNGITFVSTNKLNFRFDDATGLQVRTTAVYRDASAWMHIVCAVDTTQATASNRVKLYVNGSQITDFDTANYPAQNAESSINSTQPHVIGRRGEDGINYFNGYLANIHFIDGYAYDPSYFGQTNATTGVWDPIVYTGSYGSQGWHLDFADNSNNTASTLGKDTSGNSNNWTPNNFSVIGGGPTSVAAATGALPIYNTTDTYGATKGTGTRTDANASSLSLAIALDGTNGGTTFTDESATIKGSGSAKSITVNGNAQTSTAQSKFYGSSGYFDGSGDYLSVPVSTDLQVGSGNFTVECWFRTASNSGTIINFGELYYLSSTGYTLFIDSGLLYARTSPDASNDISVAISLNTWYHVAYVRDGTTLYLYLDGLLVGTRTAVFGALVNSATDFRVGYYSGSYQLNGYVQDVRVYKGVAKYTADFNEPTSTVQASLSAGIDSLVDTPTNGSQTDTGLGGEVVGNYCTLNPLGTAGATPTNGNLSVASSTTVGNRISTFFLTSGKWYWEGVGLGYVGAVIGSGGEGWTGSISGTGSKAIGWWFQGPVYWDGGNNGGGTTYTSTDVIGVALDMDAGNVKFYKNNSLTYTITFGSGTVPNLSAGVFPGYNNGSGSSYSVDYNFGQRPFAYPAPSGYKALCTANLPTPTIAKGSDYFDVLVWSGSGGGRSLTGLNFSPDLVWGKQRNGANSHQIYDIVRGAGNNKDLASDLTAAEGSATTSASVYGYLSSFDSAGFSVANGTDGGFPAGYWNHSGRTYAAWAWDAGSSTASNPDGSITSQVRANASAGFSIVTYTGNGTSGATIGHGLGVAPSFVVVKRRNVADSWIVYHSATGNTKYLLLNNTTAATTYSGTWNDAGPSSTTITLGNDAGVNANGGTYVCYAFSPVAGYSAFGSYTGNGSTDGPFVYTGFRPRWVMIKNSSANSLSAYGSWKIIDTSRDSYNGGNPAALYANASYAEGKRGNGDNDTYTERLDLLSNGFKLGAAASYDIETNESGVTYIYAAFAESPFAYARAR